MLNQITVIAFDLDDTLWPCLPTIEYAEETLYVWLEVNYPKITNRYSREALVNKRKQFMRDNPEYEVNLSLMRREFLRLLAVEMVYPADKLVGDSFEVFFQARQQVTFYDDVLPSLARLKQEYRLGSISNGNASVHHVGLGHLFEHSLSAVDLNLAKPDKRVFHAFAEHFEVDPQQVLYVGDHPQYDVLGPQQAGMRAVWINRENSEWPTHLPAPRHQVSDLQQLEALLAG